MGDQNDGLALRYQGLKDAKDRFGGDRVQIARRLVGDDHRRIVDQRPGNGDALLLPARGMGRQLVGVFGQFDLFEQFQRALVADPGLVGTQKVLGQHDVLHQVQLRHQLEGLVHDPHVVAAPHGQIVLVHAAHRNGSELLGRISVAPRVGIDARGE